MSQLISEACCLTGITSCTCNKLYSVFRSVIAAVRVTPSRNGRFFPTKLGANADGPPAGKKRDGARDGNGPLAGAPLARPPGQQSAIPLADRGSIVCRPCGMRSFGGAVVVACARSGDAPEPAGGVAAGQLQSRCSGWAELADPGYGERPGASALC